MKKGFTIIELMVLIALISLLSAAFMLTNQNEEQKMVLKRVSFEVFQDIREVEEMAMSAQKHLCAGGEETYSFGIHFNPVNYPESYIVFADCDGDNAFGTGDEIIKEKRIEKRAKVYRVNPYPLNVVFSPPDPIVSISGHEYNWEGEVTFKLKSDNPETVKVRINTVGRVEKK